MPSTKPQIQLLSLTEKCKICSEPAARHVHYGSRTCFSCRAFFRRSLQNNTARKFLCSRQGMCEINIRTRKSCQYCRYIKCLEVGMKPNYVLSEEERKQRFKKRRASSPGQQNCSSTIPVVLSVTVKYPVKGEVLKSDNSSQTCGQQNKDPIILLYSPNTADIDTTDIKPDCLPGTFSSDGAETNETNPNTVIQMTAAVNTTQNIPNLMDEIVENKKQHETTDDQKFPPFCEVFRKPNAKNFPSLKEYKYVHIDTKSYYDLDFANIEQKIVFPHEPEICFTEDEMYQLEQLVREHDDVYHSVNFGEVLIKEMLMCSMFGVPVSTSAAIQGYRLQVERITRIANSLTLFTNLSKIDQVTLLKENADLLVSLRGAIFFDKKKNGVDQIMSSMGVEDLSTINKTFKPLLDSHHMNHIEYRVFNSIQDPAAKKIEEHYSFLQGKVADAILDNMTSILMTYIILFSSDFCNLDDRKLVEKTQNHYLRLLERFLYSASSRPQACTKMARMLNAVTCVREMADIKKSRAINHSATAQITA